MCQCHPYIERVYWLPMYVYPHRSKIEKEFDENPLIKNLGITIYGSVHEARQREMAERKVCDDCFHITKVKCWRTAAKFIDSIYIQQDWLYNIQLNIPLCRDMLLCMLWPSVVTCKHTANLSKGLSIAMSKCLTIQDYLLIKGTAFWLLRQL